MKSLLSSASIFLLFSLFIIQCGPSEEEIKQQEQAVKDSVAEVKAEQIELAKIAAEQEAERARLEAERIEKERKYVEFDDNGPITLQVEAWRSEDIAQKSAEKWQKRGFPNAYVVQSGDTTSGDVWFRVRLARFANRSWANKQAGLLKEQYKGLGTWVTRFDEETAPEAPAAE